MEVSVLQENLHRVLGMARPFTSKACSTVRLMAKDGGLSVEANDLEKSLKVRIRAEVEKEGGICVDAAKLKAFVSTLGLQRIDFRSQNGDAPLSLVIKSGDSDATMSGIKAEDFPPMGGVENPVTASINVEELDKALGRVLFAAATEDSRPVLMSVHILLGSEGYKMEAADGFRFAAQTGPLVEAPECEVDLMVPRDTLDAVRGLLKGCDEDVRVSVDSPGNRVEFSIGGCEVVSQCVTGTFPNCDKLIPTDPSWTVQADVGALKNALRTVSVFSNGFERIIRLMTAEGPDPNIYSVRVSAGVEGVGEAKREVVGAVTTGLDKGDELAGRIAFNPKWIYDLLMVVDGRMEIGCSTPGSPAVWRITTDESFIYVIMPMSINW